LGRYSIIHKEPLNKIVQPNALHIFDTEIKFKVKSDTYNTLCKTRSSENLMVPEILASDKCPVGNLIVISEI
jgi:hypothetical protein